MFYVFNLKTSANSTVKCVNQIILFLTLQVCVPLSLSQTLPLFQIASLPWASLLEIKMSILEKKYYFRKGRTSTCLFVVVFFFLFFLLLFCFRLFSFFDHLETVYVKTWSKSMWTAKIQTMHTLWIRKCISDAKTVHCILENPYS